ncbi:MAG TPA: sigma-54-dependent Fis family transcriptional regulator [Steroidobacteraceae bacterium]|jgi:transcriptional regulator of acetoin/glycerol metabolism|nr:sigma-54-dependent Fis family transcriptional regulator [Steroidobacteraceae bacterium]
MTHAVGAGHGSRPVGVDAFGGAAASAAEVEGGRRENHRARYAELIAIAQSEIDRLQEQIRGSGYAVLLTDAAGEVLYEKFDSSLPKVPLERMGPGVAVRGPGAEIVAVLDAACLAGTATRASHLHMLALINLSAHIIEKCLFLRYHQHHAVLRFHVRPELVDLLHDGALALAPDGTVIGADRAAEKLLGSDDRYQLVGRPVSDIFDAEGEDFVALALLKCATLCPVRETRRGQRFYASVHGGSNARSTAGAAADCARPTVVQVASSPRTHALTLEELAGEDPQMLRNVRSAHRIADSGVSVLIQGPTGSGKEAFAHAMHLVSHRANRPFVAVNCAAIPENLIESELFGYKAGAFTGARKEGMKGKILQSSGGTLFLDEIGDMPLALQTRLLRVLEEQQIVPLGSETGLEVDLHVLAASHHNLREMIARGAFREDLYYRLNGITLELPALAQRVDRERVIHRVLGAETTDGRPAAIEMDALARLVAYPWPGNIRELRNVIRTALAICEGGVVRQIDLPREIREHASASPPPPVAATSPAAAPAATSAPANPLQAAERATLVSMIENCRGNMTRTAELLGMSRTTLYRKLKRHEIVPAHG